MKDLRKALKAGRPVIGTWLNSGSPAIAELLASCGFDFVCVDAEHSAVDVPQAMNLFQAITAGRPDCAPFVRLHGVDYALVKRYLDAGARGVVCPLVNTAADARLLVDAVKYPPLGRRGVGFCRANKFGVTVTDEFERANHEIVTAIQIEHIDGVRNLDSILSVPGIDAVFIGPYDLTASMGIAAQFDNPAYVLARDQILRACQKAGVVAGIHVVQPNPEELIQRVQEGYRLLAYSLDITMLLNSCQTGIRRLDAAFPERAKPGA